MKSEIKNCQNCKQSFTVEPDDFAFYEKVKVPPPTWCPECRMQRRMLHLNIRTLYKRSCDLCKKETISLFPKDSKFIVYCPACWWSDNWDPMEYGRDYDFSKPFFQQLKELLERTPQFGPQTMHTTMVNSDYCNICSYLKNCYLLFNSDYSENCSYSTYLEHGKDTLDIYMGDECELCYDSSNLYKCHKVFFSSNCNECVDVAFSRNLVGCSNCFGSVNLKAKQYYIFNEPYTKESYFEKLKEFDLGSYHNVSLLKKKVADLNLRYPRKFFEGLKNLNSSGDYVFNSKNTISSYEVGGCEDCKYCQFLFLSPTRDSVDVTMWGGNLTRGYDSMGVGGGQNSIRFCFDTWMGGSDLDYSCHILFQNANLFGCYALRHKQYCILNKQYSKEEYEELVEKIKKQMDETPFVDSKGRKYTWGEFFPPEVSAFAYNESVAQEYFPLTKEQSLRQGFGWKEPEKRTYAVSVLPEQLPDNISEVQNSILGEVVGCLHKEECMHQCSSAFKITAQELQFYRQLNLPIPRLCSNCRHYERLAQRTNATTRFLRRPCQCVGLQSANSIYRNATTHFHGAEKCSNEFETSYAPDHVNFLTGEHVAGRPEIVYCEQCYQAEVA